MRSLLLIGGWWCAAAGSVAASAPDEINLALGKKVQVHPHKAGESKEPYARLTNGKYAQGVMWDDPEALDWISGNSRSITIDLGDDMPIGGISVSAAIGARIRFATEGKVWPGFIDLFLSNDGSEWHPIGELGELHEIAHGPYEGINGQAYRRQVIRAPLATHGRFVKLVFTRQANLVLDEITVLKGEESNLGLNLPQPALPSSKVYAFLEEQDYAARVLRRQYRHDIAGIRKKLKELSADAAAAISRELDLLQERIATGTVVPADRKVILPSGPLGEAINRQLSAVYRAQKREPVVLWSSAHWACLDWMAEPPLQAAKPKVELKVMQGEHRSASFNLTNTTDREQEFILSFRGLPGGAQPEYIQVHPVLWTTTSWKESVATALANPESEGEGIRVTLPSGVTRQVWLNIEGPGEAGAFEGEIRLQPKDTNLAALSVPIRLTVSPLKMPKDRALHLGGWDYSESLSYGVHQQNLRPFVSYLRRYSVDSPWGWRGNMPFGTFSESNDYATPAAEPDTKRFNRWVKEIWPDSYRYYVYIEIYGRKGPSNFPGLDYKGDKERFEARVATWLRFWEKHVRELGIDPGQICMKLTDEIGGNPKNAFYKDEALRIWTEAFKKAGVGFKLWLNPIYDEPWDADQESLKATDILCGKFNRFLDNGERYRQYWVDELAPGKELAFYECRSDPSPLYDPYSYFRMQAWIAWKYGARSIFFWSFGSNGSEPRNSFDPGRRSAGFSPLFLDQSAEVIGSKQMEAIRESVEDYQYLYQLKQAIADGAKENTNAALIAKATALLDSATDRVFRVEDIQKQPRWLWKTEIPRTEADQIRLEILDLLEQLASAR